MCKINKCSAADEVCVYVDDLAKTVCVKLINNITTTTTQLCSPHCTDYLTQQCCSNRGKCQFNEKNYTHRCSCNLSYSGIIY